MASGMLVIALLLSSLALLPGTTVKGASADNQISFNVVDSDGNNITGVQAVLKEVHTLKQYTTTTSSGGLATFSPWPGYYTLELTKSGYYDLTYSSVIRYDSLSPVPLFRVVITPQPTAIYSLDLTVLKNGTIDPVSNVRLRVLDANESMQEIYNDTSVGGTFTVPVYATTCKLVVTASGFSVNVSTIVVSGSTTQTMYMDPSFAVRGYVYMNGVPVTKGLKAYMVSTNVATDIEKRIVKPKNIGANYFDLDAYAGEFYLLVDGENAKANMTKFTLTAAETMTVNLTAQAVQKTTKDVAFYEGDWNHFNLTESSTLEYDANVPGLDFNYIPNIRMQIDFAIGNGDGQVSTSELNSFKTKIGSFGPQNITTEWLMKVNGTRFVAQTSGFTSIDYTGLVGLTDITANYTSTMVTLYDTVSPVAVSGSLYTGDLYANFDTATMNYSYTVDLPNLYELTANSTGSVYVKVAGYTTLNVEPSYSTAIVPADVKMTFQKSSAPTAAAAIVTGSNAYSKLLNSTVQYYVVANDTNVTFTSAGSTDPNGNPLTYMWEFGDANGTNVATTTTVYKYTSAKFNVTAKLTVRDVAGLEANASFQVRIDSMNPFPIIDVKNKNIVSTYSPSPSDQISANQTEAIIFNGAKSIDYINSTSDPEKGIIASWKWDFGDGNSTTVLQGETQNVTHAYARAGNYTVKLNTTDVVGHYATSQLNVVVKDTTAPIVSFVIKNSKFQTVESAIENTTLYFDGNATMDNVDSLQNLTYAWDFGDGETANTVNATHNFTNIKTFTVKLTVTDKSGNSANLTKQLVITSSPRPDLRIVVLTFTPTQFTEGESGSMILNITNVGNSNATNIVATFYRMSITGEKFELGTETSLTINGTPASLLKPNQSGLITFSWTADGKGNYTIYVVVTSDRETNKADNTITSSLTVKEAGWKAAAIYGGIFAVIIVVIVLIYMRKRLPLPSRKGKEEKQEKTKQEQKGKK
jgi:PKD repeat protein